MNLSCYLDDQQPTLCRVKVKQKGGNSSVVGGKELVKEGEAVGKHGDKVEINKISVAGLILAIKGGTGERQLPLFHPFLSTTR